jgi:acetyl esterase/lipase
MRKMLHKILKTFLYGLLTIIVICALWLGLPRTWSALNPNKPPVGYFWLVPTYTALWLGIEKPMNLEPAIPDNIEEIKDIEYKNINGKSLQIDLYRLKGLSGKSPLLVFIHGGSWKWGKRSDYLVYLVDYAKRGYITATVTYRLLNDGPYPNCIVDINDAVDWFFRNGDNYGYDTSRIALIGGSAGGHLAMLSAYGWNGSTQNNDSAAIPVYHHKIKAVVDIYGPADLTTEYARNHKLISPLIGHSYEERPDLFLEASPVHYIDKDDPPTMILQGTADELLPVSQSDNLKKKLEESGVTCVYYRLPGWPHVMDAVQRVNVFCQDKMTGFFEQYLK